MTITTTTKVTNRTLAALAPRPEAEAAWHHLGAVLADLADAGRIVPCRVDPAPFTSDRAADRREAASACAGCPAREACARFSTANREVFGVWGALDHAPRARGTQRHRPDRRLTSDPHTGG